MKMPDGFYLPRPLSTSRIYPGYQFYAVMRFDGHSADECLRYAALTVQGWLCDRIKRANGGIPEEISCVPAERFMDITTSELKSAKLPFLEINFLTDDGIWTLMLNEPDSDIAARSYVTHVGMRVKNDEVEFGTYIDVVDSDLKLPEQDRAYRPQFVRLLFETPGMTFIQAEPLIFKGNVKVSDKRGVSRLKALADDKANQLPLVIFTHAKNSPAYPPDMDQLLREIMSKPVLPGIGPRSSRLNVEPEPQKTSYSVPYDAEEFSRHIYGFARTYVVMKEAFGDLKSRFNKVHIKEGDILIVEPKPFGGALRVISYREGLSSEWYKSVTDELTSSLQCYSKHKPYSYGSVLFEDQARQILREREFEALRASVRLENSEQFQQMVSLLEKERETSREQVRYINELRAQMLVEYNRGAESEKHRSEQLKAMLDQIKAENAALKANNETMKRSFSEFSAMKEITEKVQSVEKMPETNEDVVAYFQLIFQDRIGFTDRGRKTAEKCDVNPDMLWSCLYITAGVLVDLYRSGVSDIENAFKQRTGWELAPSEGAETRKRAELMSLRKDSFEGREISIEPHIKFPRSARKTGAQYQRLYYAYDIESHKVIVGYVGDHLENYLSLSVH